MTQLRNILIAGLIVVQLVSCSIQNKNNLGTSFKGDLFFKLVGISGFYAADSLAVKKFNNYLDSLNAINPDLLPSNYKEVMAVFNGLKKYGLIEKPSFQLRIDSLKTWIVYVDTIEYKKIRKFNRLDLIDENKKVVIELTGDTVNLSEGWMVIDCRKIHKVEKVDGITHWKK
jgi:hypothetical protein